MADPIDRASGRSFGELLERARRGDRVALEQVLRDCRLVLRRMAERQMPPELRKRFSPSDVAQESLLEASRDFASFRGEGNDDLKKWLGGILRHNLQDLLRHLSAGKRDSRREIPLDDERSFAGLRDRLEDRQPGPEEVVERRDETESVRQFIGSLPGRAREVLRLRYEEHMSYEEIGTRLRCSADAARMLCVRALSNVGRRFRAF